MGVVVQPAINIGRRRHGGERGRRQRQRLTNDNADGDDVGDDVGKSNDEMETIGSDEESLTRRTLVHPTSYTQSYNDHRSAFLVRTETQAHRPRGKSGGRGVAKMNNDNDDGATTTEEEDCCRHRLASSNAVFVDVGRGAGRPFVVFALKLER